MEKTEEKKNYKAKMHKIVYAVGVLGVIMINIASWNSVGFSDWYIKNIFPRKSAEGRGIRRGEEKLLLDTFLLAMRRTRHCLCCG